MVRVLVFHHTYRLKIVLTLLSIIRHKKDPEPVGCLQNQTHLFTFGQLAK